MFRQADIRLLAAVCTSDNGSAITMEGSQTMVAIRFREFFGIPGFCQLVKYRDCVFQRNALPYESSRRNKISFRYICYSEPSGFGNRCRSSHNLYHNPVTFCGSLSTYHYIPYIVFCKYILGYMTTTTAYKKDTPAGMSSLIMTANYMG